MKLLISLIVLLTLCGTCGCIPNGQNMTFLEQVQLIQPYVEDITAVSVYLVLDKKSGDSEFLSNLKIFVAAVDGIVTQEGSIDFAGLKVLSAKYLPGKYSLLADVIIDIAEREINKLPQVQNPDEKMEGVRVLCKAVVDGVKRAIEKIEEPVTIKTDSGGVA